jgi:hypothetical protein
MAHGGATKSLQICSNLSRISLADPRSNAFHALRASQKFRISVDVQNYIATVVLSYKPTKKDTPSSKGVHQQLGDGGQNRKREGARQDAAKSCKRPILDSCAVLF